MADIPTVEARVIRVKNKHEREAAHLVAMPPLLYAKSDRTRSLTASASLSDCCATELTMG